MYKKNNFLDEKTDICTTEKSAAIALCHGMQVISGPQPDLSWVVQLLKHFFNFCTNELA
jgi:hypothetical protein